jgi:transcriptional regulator with XRE-family HTH domain
MSSVTVRGQPPVARPRNLVTIPNLLQWRTWKGLRQTDLAEQAGVNAATVGRAEQGAALTPRAAAKLAAALGIPLLQLQNELPPTEQSYLLRWQSGKDAPEA